MGWNINLFGLKLTGTGEFRFWWLLLLIPISILLITFLATLALYAFVQLTGLLVFSWMNVLWTLILLLAAKYVFGSYSGG